MDGPIVEDEMVNSYADIVTCGAPENIVLSMGWWCSGILSGLPRRRWGVQIPDPPTLEKCAKGICLCNLLRSTQPNDRETVIEG